MLIFHIANVLLNPPNPRARKKCWYPFSRISEDLLCPLIHQKFLMYYYQSLEPEHTCQIQREYCFAPSDRKVYQSAEVHLVFHSREDIRSEEHTSELQS